MTNPKTEENVKNFKFSYLSAALCGLVLFGVAGRVDAQYITDGNFTQFTTTSGGGTANPGSANGGQLGYNITDTATSSAGWVNGSASGVSLGYNFIMTPGAAMGSGATGTGGYAGGVYGNGGLVALWNQHDGGISGPGGYITAPPLGGNILVDDSDYEVTAVTTILKNLSPKTTYFVTFYYAAGQQEGFTGTTTDSWQVSTTGGGSFGTNATATYTTPTITLPSQEFSGWNTATFAFTTGTSTRDTNATLSFTANGSPQVPPFLMLADVSVVPEPSTILAGAFVMLPIGYRIVRSIRNRKSN